MWKRFGRARRRDVATALVASVLTTLASGGHRRGVGGDAARAAAK